MNITSDKSIILRLIQKATKNHSMKNREIINKKILQESMYFFNLKHNSFHFKWTDCGPTSAEVQQIIQDLDSGKQITINSIKTRQSKKIQGKNIQYVDGSFDFKDFPKELDDMLDDIIIFVAKRESQELELFASVHFWVQRRLDSKNQYTAKSCYNTLVDLKLRADLKFTDVERAVQILEINGFLDKDNNAIKD